MCTLKDLKKTNKTTKTGLKNAWDEQIQDSYCSDEQYSRNSSERIELPC